MAIVSGAGGTFNSNPWTVISNAWNAGALVYGRDYTQQVVYDPANPNEGVSASWSFPGRSGPNLTVLSYPALGYGASPWNATIAGSESKFPIKISDISSLVFNHDVSISGQTDGYNIAYDLWLTSTPGGTGATVTHEIMIWIHTGAGGPAGSVVSSYRDDVFNGSIYTAKMTDAAGSSTHSWQYVAIQAQGDDLMSQVDFGAMLTQLKALGIVTGNEYLADVQLGAEITFGSGAYTINYMDVNLNGAGNYLQKEDDALRGTARTEHLYLYGQNAPQTNGALYGNLQASTFDTDHGRQGAGGQRACQWLEAGCLHPGPGAQRLHGQLRRNLVRARDLHRASAWPDQAQRAAASLRRPGGGGRPGADDHLCQRHHRQRRAGHHRAVLPPRGRGRAADEHGGRHRPVERRLHGSRRQRLE